MPVQGARVSVEPMTPSVPGQPEAFEDQIVELEKVRGTLITTVLDARAACETATDGPRAQLLLSAAVNDVEILDEHLHALRNTEVPPIDEYGAARVIEDCQRTSSRTLCRAL